MPLARGRSVSVWSVCARKAARALELGWLAGAPAGGHCPAPRTPIVGGR